MKDFRLNSAGDLGLLGADLDLVSGTEQKIQTLHQILSTNKGEWKFDPEEGIDHAAFYQKEPIPSRMAEAIQDGMQQTDSNYRLQSFSYSIQNKALTVQVTADGGEAAALTANI